MRERERERGRRKGRIETRERANVCRLVLRAGARFWTLRRAEGRGRKERKRRTKCMYTPGVYDIPGISELAVDTLAKKLKEQSDLMFVCIKVDKFLSRFNLLIFF